MLNLLHQSMETELIAIFAIAIAAVVVPISTIALLKVGAVGLAKN